MVQALGHVLSFIVQILPELLVIFVFLECSVIIDFEYKISVVTSPPKKDRFRPLVCLEYRVILIDLQKDRLPGRVWTEIGLKKDFLWFFKLHDLSFVIITSIHPYANKGIVKNSTEIIYCLAGNAFVFYLGEHVHVAEYISSGPAIELEDG